MDANFLKPIYPEFNFEQRQQLSQFIQGFMLGAQKYMALNPELDSNQGLFLNPNLTLPPTYMACALTNDNGRIMFAINPTICLNCMSDRNSYQYYSAREGMDFKTPQNFGMLIGAHEVRHQYPGNKKLFDSHKAFRDALASNGLDIFQIYKTVAIKHGLTNPYLPYFCYAHEIESVEAEMLVIQEYLPELRTKYLKLIADLTKVQVEANALVVSLLKQRKEY